MSKQINLHNVLNFSDLEQGYKKLKKKKKYKDPRGKDIYPRYVPQEDREENKLKKFLESEVKTEEQRIHFFESLQEFSLDHYDAFAISKGKGFRPLLVPSPKDRLVFDSLLPKYFELFEDQLRERSLLGIGLVKNQRVSDILHEIFDCYVSKGYHYALTIDYSSFFSNIDRDTLFEKFQVDFGNGPLYKILQNVVLNNIDNGLSVQQKTGVKILENGIPQGLSFSPLLASYYALDIDDIYISDPNIVGYRYIDDIMLFAKNKKDLVAVFGEIEKKSKELKMKAHPLGVEGSKTELRDLSSEKIVFLGVEISVTNGLQISDGKFEEIISVIRKEVFNIRVILNRNPDEIKKIYYRYISGWLNHYEKIHSNPNELHSIIDALIHEKYFKKKKVRERFYAKNNWIKISNNKELLKKRH